jgi:predicted transcriptional regulator
MDAALLIDAIVRQTTVLIATLATTSGHRAQLAHVANSVFADLVRELRAQGLTNKVIADMFGMALRTYRRRVARLSSSRTEQGRSLWDAVLRHIQEHGPVERSALLARFHLDDEAVLRSVLADLQESGLVERTAREDSARFESAQPDRGAQSEDSRAAKLEAMVLVAVHRAGPLAVEGIAEFVPADRAELDEALSRLARDGLVAVRERSGRSVYSCDLCVIPFGDAAGWEAAVLDHYQAMVAALVSKLRSGARRAGLEDRVGGSTFVFDLWQGHPLQDEVLDYLKRMRQEGLRLRSALDQHAARAGMPGGAAPLPVVAYVGQSVVDGEGEEDD